MRKEQDTDKDEWVRSMELAMDRVWETVCGLLTGQEAAGRVQADELLGEALTGSWAAWARNPGTFPPCGSVNVENNERFWQELAVPPLPSLYEAGLRNYCPSCHAEAGQNCNAPRLSKSADHGRDYPPTHKARYRYWVQVEQWKESVERRKRLKELGFDV